MPDGTYPVTVTAPNNSSCTLANALTIKAGAVSGCSVDFSAPFCLASSNGTQQIVIAGSGFQPGSIVYVGSTAVTPSYQDDRIIVFTAPAIATGSYPIVVRTPQGSQCNAGGFLIVDPVSCTGTPCSATAMAPTCVKPGQGAASHVTITGSDFGNPVSVVVNGDLATIVSSTPNQIVFDPPAEPDGEYAVQILSGTEVCLAPRMLQLTSTTCGVATQPTTWGRVKARYR